MPGLQNIPPRGGTLFSDKTTEGKFLSIVKLPDNLVARLILTLGTTRPRRGVGNERISFRELEIEQLGSVYEGLLEYEPKTADETMIEINAQGKEYALVPSELCRLCDQKNLSAKGDSEILAGTEAERLHTDFSENDDIEEDLEEDNGNGDADGDDSEPEEDEGIKKGAAVKLVRRLEKGDFYFVPGSARKASGSFYTCEEIVLYLVRNGLGDLVESKSSSEIESLRLIDPACGSGHFLVGAARYLGKKLHETYRRELKNEPPKAFYPDRELSHDVKEKWEKESEAWCRRRVIEKCLYGVDLNPTAVQLAQVALWIESLAGDRPLSFFAHHIRCGNSLLGTTLAKVKDPIMAEKKKKAEAQPEFFEIDIEEIISQALEQRKLIEVIPDGVHKDNPEEYNYKSARLAESEKILKYAKLLFNLRSASYFLDDIREEWWSIVREHDLEEYILSKSWFGKYEKIYTEQKFFHWELEFPEIFRGARKGFDCVLGNPPWEKVKPDRKEFYGRYDILIRAYKGGELDARIRELHQKNPELEDQFNAYSETTKTTSTYLKKSGDYKYCDWIVDGKSTGGDSDLFKFFVERAHQILRESGRLGFLIPSAVYNNEGCTGLRHLILDMSMVITFYGFENRQKLFPIDSRYKFVCLALEKKASKNVRPDDDVEFYAAFMRHYVQELEHKPPENVQVLIKRSEIEKFSPGTLAFLEYRSPKDREIVLKMYGLLPEMTQRPLLGDEGRGTWDAKYYREFDMTNDKDLWTKSNGKLYTPKETCGLDWPADKSIPFCEVRKAMDKEGFWPLYEGKMIELLLVDICPVSRWVKLESVKEKYKEWEAVGESRLCFRDTAGNTNERTCLCTIVPERSCFNNKLPILIPNGVDTSKALSVMSSFAFDYILRFRISTTLNFTHIGRVAVPSPDEIAGVLEGKVYAKSQISGDIVADDPSFFSELWNMNKSVALAYGLTPSDFSHILSSFPVFARKRPEFYAYLQEKIKEWRDEG